MSEDRIPKATYTLDTGINECTLGSIAIVHVNRCPAVPIRVVISECSSVRLYLRPLKKESRRLIFNIPHDEPAGDEGREQDVSLREPYIWISLSFAVNLVIDPGCDWTSWMTSKHIRHRRNCNAVSLRDKRRKKTAKEEKNAYDICYRVLVKYKRNEV